jgi:phage tail tape-measure protein
MNTNNKERPDDIEQLLPWHAAGTLSRRDAERVERALANDNELAARYEEVREELGAAINLNESLGAPSARAMNDLFARIDAEPARQPKSSFSLGGWFAGLFSNLQPRTLAVGASVAMLAIVVQAGALTGLLMQDAGTYGVASVERKPVTRSMSDAGTSGGTYVLIRFNAGASIADVSKFLIENNAVITDGPAAGSGLYRMRVADRELPEDQVKATVKRMQGNPVVGLTVPSAQ